MKKYLSLLLLIFLPLLASAADPVNIDGIYYTLITKAKKAQVTSGAQKYTGNVVIPSTVVYNDETYDVVLIEDNAFNSSKELTSVSVPSSVTSIGKWAFAYCTNLTTVILADGVTTLEEHVFHACESLMSLDIPNSVTSIGNIAFAGCRSLSTIKLPENITVIRQSSFQNCVSLTSITIPANVKEIEKEVFNECTGLTSITIPEGVTTLGSQLFYKCTSLTTATLANSVTSIGNGLFNGCSALTNVTLPNGITQIPYATFRDCVALTTVNLPATVTTLGEFAFENCKELTSLQLPSGLTTIDSGAFLKCDKLTSMDFPSTLTTIGNQVFKDCSLLASAPIPEGVTAIGSEAFRNCAALTNIHIPNSVTTIGDYVFQNCTSATSLTIGSGLTMLSNYLFTNCSSLTSVTIPDNVTSMGSQIFRDCSGITQLTIGSGLKDLPNGSFRGCSSLTEVNIPSQVTIIYTEVFYQCTKLKTIILGSGIQSISALAFASCDALTDVYCYAKNPPSAYDKTPESQYTFKDSYIEYATLHVPAASMDAYKSKSPWSLFGEFVALADPDYTLTYYVDGELYKTYQVKEGATITPEPAPTKEGYSFSGWEGLPEVMPAHDVDVNGTFSINKYKLIYMVDGAEYKTYEVEYNTIVPREEEPTKEGYTFSGWSAIPQMMPAHDVTITGTFSVNKYLLTYLVDGVEYKKYEVEYGATITPEAAPTKEGYTFSGWSDLPETMPAHDVTVSGFFSKGAYKLIYVVDGETYKTVSYDYGATIIPEAAPTKEGYTFSGWSEIPETMPAYDVTVTGTFSVNKYLLTYLVDGVEYKKYEVEYGATITPEVAPTKEGYTFSGWIGLPETMPAHDVTVNGGFNINQYTITYVIDNEEYMKVLVDYGSIITPPDAPEREGYDFAWGDYPETMPAYDITIYGTYTTGIDAIMAGKDGHAKIYTLDGKLLNQAQKGINIVRMSDGTVRKVVVK